MNLDDIKYCPRTLAEGFKTYSPAALRILFGRKKVSHILDFNAPDADEEVAERLRLNSSAISISGAQFKQSLVVENNKLRLTKQGEPGQYILKPIPSRPPFGKREELPANEHLTMQIAKQAFGIVVAECALVFFNNGEPAYIAKRFDYAKDGRKIAQEDFASISGRSKEKDGESYRNSGSYEDTAIHIPADSFFALSDGLFSNEFNTESFKVLGFYAYDDFFEFGLQIGMMESRIRKILDKYRNKNQKVLTLIKSSFLSDPIKQLYTDHYIDRLKMLNTSFSHKI